MEANSFGANIIEIITAGMYQDSKVIYREYIQNACDQIDLAEKMGILKNRDANSKYPDLGSGEINIWLQPERRYIAIEDNATGIKSESFQKTLLNIAASEKIVGQNKGFRGIGRLCGLAYCKTLVFTARWSDEPTVSIMTCDALKMREMINEANMNIQEHTAYDVLGAITEFSTRPANKSDSAHFFKVELFDINSENEELFGGKSEDNLVQLTDYLSFVAPVPYQGNFLYRKEIYDYARSISTKIDEYSIKINGTPIFKKYKTNGLKTGNGEDKVFGVAFHEFVADDGSLMGWMWFGKTSFKAAIKEEEISRGLRLRKENIQIGDDATLRNMFTREASRRGNNYFIGEVFAVSPKLIPNSQRSYFNENPIRIDFEHKMKDYFNNTLYDIYYDGSDTNSSIKKIVSFNEKVAVYEKKVADGGFLTDDEREREERELKAKEQEAEKAQAKLDKKREAGRSILTSEIIQRRTDEIPTLVKSETLATVPSAPKKGTIEPDAGGNDATSPKIKKKSPYLVETMFPQASRNEHKLLSKTLEKIFAIIQKTTDKKTSEKIINSIKDELK
ncbi:MAG: ATP-binding protein [Defluviitaleaceae bacterium]|nr:ATP-binding protein [Defluviitaleaceae bacterium]